MTRQEEKSTWDYLVHNIEAQIDLYSGLLDLLTVQKGYIVKNHTDKLSENISQQDAINIDLYKLQDQFDRYASRIVVGGSSDNLSLRYLISVSPPQYREKLRALEKELITLTRTISKVNTVNQNLIHGQFKYIRYMMKKLVEINSYNQNVYNYTGQLQDMSTYSNLMNVVA